MKSRSLLIACFVLTLMSFGCSTTQRSGARHFAARHHYETVEEADAAAKRLDSPETTAIINEVINAEMKQVRSPATWNIVQLAPVESPGLAEHNVFATQQSKDSTPGVVLFCLYKTPRQPATDPGGYTISRRTVEFGYFIEVIANDLATANKQTDVVGNKLRKALSKHCFNSK